MNSKKFLFSGLLLEPEVALHLSDKDFSSLFLPTPLDSNILVSEVDWQELPNV